MSSGITSWISSRIPIWISSMYRLFEVSKQNFFIEIQEKIYDNIWEIPCVERLWVLTINSGWIPRECSCITRWFYPRISSKIVVGIPPAVSWRTSVRINKEISKAISVTIFRSFLKSITRNYFRFRITHKELMTITVRQFLRNTFKYFTGMLPATSSGISPRIVWISSGNLLLVH